MIYVFPVCISDTSDFGGNLLTSIIPTAIPDSRLTPTNLKIAFSLDNVANEGIERGILRMKISEDSAQPPNTFFKRDLRVAINDTTSE